MKNTREISWIKCNRGKLYPCDDFCCEIGLEESVNNEGGRSIAPLGGNKMIWKSSWHSKEA